MSETDTLLQDVLVKGRFVYERRAEKGDTANAVGYHPNGAIFFRYPLLDGKFHGLGRMWFDDGRIQRAEEFLHNRYHGARREWYQSGAMKLEAYYVTGALNGPYREWYETGELKASAEYHRNDGTLRIYDTSGNLLREEVYSNDRTHLSRKRWFPDGRPESEEHYIHENRHGVFREWHQNGMLWTECPFENGQRHGMRREWHDNGRLMRREPYIRGLRHGICWSLSADGKACLKKIYIRGVHITGPVHDLINSGGLTAQYILGIRNAAVRRICLEELGYSRFLAQLPHDIIDTDGDYELVKIDWHRREEPICLVKVKCPSTGAFYTLRVPPTMKTVKEAVAWTFALDPDKYLPELET